MNRSDLQAICCGHAAWDLNFMMDGFPVEDEKYKIDNLIQTGGGPAANAACLLARWGVRTAYAGLVGGDVYGRLIIQELEATGVDTSLVQTAREGNTPLSAVIVNRRNGSRTLLNRRNASDQPAVDSRTLQRLRGLSPRVLHFDGHALDLSLKLMELFPDAEVVMDAGSYRAATDRLCAAADYAICSKRYAQEASGKSDIESEAGRQRCIRLLGERYPGRVAVTLGDGGLYYGRRTGEAPERGIEPVSMPAFKVDAVDSTGAGDIFHAAFSYSLISGLRFEDGIRLASAAAALSVQVPGGRTSIPEPDQSMYLAGLAPKREPRG